MTASVRTDLAVTFARKDEAKKLGARWDGQARTWYAPAGVALDPFRAAGFLAQALKPHYRLHRTADNDMLACDVLAFDDGRFVRAGLLVNLGRGRSARSVIDRIGEDLEIGFESLDCPFLIAACKGRYGALAIIDVDGVAHAFGYRGRGAVVPLQPLSRIFANDRLRSFAYGLGDHYVFSGLTSWEWREMLSALERKNSGQPALPAYLSTNEELVLGLPAWALRKEFQPRIATVADEDFKALLARPGSKLIRIRGRMCLKDLTPCQPGVRQPIDRAVYDEHRFETVLAVASATTSDAMIQRWQGHKLWSAVVATIKDPDIQPWALPGCDVTVTTLTGEESWKPEDFDLKLTRCERPAVDTTQAAVKLMSADKIRKPQKIATPTSLQMQRLLGRAMRSDLAARSAARQARIAAREAAAS